MNEYNFIDDKLPITTEQLTIYTRLQSLDNDGKLTYSEARKLTTNHSSLNVNVFLNPANDVVNIVDSNIKEIRVINYLGQ